MDSFDAILAFLISACAIRIAYDLGYSRAIREIKPRVDALEAAVQKQTTGPGDSNG